MFNLTAMMSGLLALIRRLVLKFEKLVRLQIVSADAMNENLNTVIVAPMTSKRKKWPSRINVDFNQVKGSVALDQLRSVDKKRLVKKLGILKSDEAERVSASLVEMFVER